MTLRGAAEFVAELAELGVRAQVAACDVADSDALAGLLDEVAAERPLTAVVHTAGVLDDVTVASLSADRLERVLRPKADATWNLHRLTESLDLASFVLFSSIAGLAWAARARPTTPPRTPSSTPSPSTAAPGTCPPPPRLEPVGQRRRHGRNPRRRRRRPVEAGGIVPLADLGLDLFDAALASAEPLLVPRRTRPDRPARPRHGERAPRTVHRPGPRPPQAGGRHRPWRRLVVGRAVIALTAEERAQAVLRTVRETVGLVLGHGADADIDPARAFKDTGFDSSPASNCATASTR